MMRNGHLVLAVALLAATTGLDGEARSSGEGREPAVSVGKTPQAEQGTTATDDLVRYVRAQIDGDQIRNDADEAGFLAGVRDYDQEMLRQREPAQEVLENASTREQLELFLSSHATTLFALHSDYHTGGRLALQASRVLKKLLKRKDFAPSAISLYRDDVFDPDRLSDCLMAPREWEPRLEHLRAGTAGNFAEPSREAYMTGTVSMRVHYRSQLLMYPDFLALLKGHEKQAIEMLAQNDRKIENANRKCRERTGRTC